MKKTALLPTRGTLIRNPLPMMEASGVPVAAHDSDPAKRLEKAK